MENNKRRKVSRVEGSAAADAELWSSAPIDTTMESSARQKGTKVVPEEPPSVDDEELWKIRTSSSPSRSVRPVSTLQELENLLALDKHFSMIWVSDEAAILHCSPGSSRPFLRGHLHIFPGSTNWGHFSAGSSKNRSRLDFAVYALSSTDAEACLARILNLQCRTQYYEKMSFDASDTQRCKWSGDLFCSLAKRALHISERLVLIYLKISPEVIRTLLTCVGEKHEIKFICCKFSDEGATFVETLEEIADRSFFSGISLYYVPLQIKYFRRLLAIPLKPRIAFRPSNPFDAAQCSAFSACRLQTIRLEDSNFADNMHCFLQLMRNGQGPRELSFGRKGDRARIETLYTKKDTWEPLLQALGSASCSLQSLEFNRLEGQVNPPSCISFVHFARALPCALLYNTSLKELRIRYDMEADQAGMMCQQRRKFLVSEIMLSVAAHPSLCRVDLKAYIPCPYPLYGCHSRDYRNDAPFTPLTTSLGQTKSVANMLRANKNVEDVKFYDHMYDKKEWKREVAPLLECNTYRKRAESLAGRTGPNPDGVLARAFSSVSTQLTPFWLLILQNQNAIATSIALGVS